MASAPLVLSAIQGTSLTDLEKSLILEHRVLGFTLFKRNIASLEAVRELTAQMQELAQSVGYRLILAVDHEGGRVFRLPPPFTKIPPMRHWGQYFERTGDIEPLYQLGQILGSEARYAGFNLNFAPVVDVDLNDINPIIGDRSFSKQPEVVAKCARHIIRGLANAGVLSCLKHFPGHGATSKDSHLELPLDERDLADITKDDLLPYQKLFAENLAPTVMTAHVQYSKLDSNHPATVSQPIMQTLLRDTLNYRGVVFSDDLFMKAIADHYGFVQATKLFYEVGGDVVLMCHEPEQTLKLITDFKNLPHDDNVERNLTLARARVEQLQSLLQSYEQQSPLAVDFEKNQKWVDEIFKVI